MKKILFAATLCSIFFACKKENKNEQVVGKNAEGKELVVNASGDTIVKTETSNDTVAKPLETANEVTAIKKNEDGTYEFRYNLEKGKTYPVTLSIKGVHTASSGSENMKMSNESKKTIEYTVKDFTNGIYTLEVKSKHYNEKMTDPQGKSMSFDTNSGKPSAANTI